MAGVHQDARAVTRRPEHAQDRVVNHVSILALGGDDALAQTRLLDGDGELRRDLEDGLDLLRQEVRG